MNEKERQLLDHIYAGIGDYEQRILDEYGSFIEQDIRYHARLGLFPRKDNKYLVYAIIRVFVRFVQAASKSPSDFSIKQLLHLLTVRHALWDYLYHLKEIRPFPWMYDDLLFPLSFFDRPFARRYARPQESPIAQYLVVEEGDGPLTPTFLSSILMPYVEAVSSIQRVCNALLGRMPQEIVIKFIGQNSPTEIKLVDAAEAINAIKEDIIPWRRKNAQKIAELKQQELAADIKKREAEALEIQKQSSREDEKAQAEIAKAREEVEQMRLENEKRRFELQKAKIELALEIVTKMQPDLPIAEKYAHALQLLPSIDAIANSPIEPALLP